MDPARKPKTRAKPAKSRPRPAGFETEAGKVMPDGAQRQRLRVALGSLAAVGSVTGVRSRKLSVRIDPGVMDAATRQLGLTSPSDVVNASLALAAAPDRFKIWLRETRDSLPDDFELPV